MLRRAPDEIVAPPGLLTRPARSKPSTCQRTTGERTTVDHHNNEEKHPHHHRQLTSPVAFFIETRLSSLGCPAAGFRIAQAERAS
jgi:hypothetical protein